MIYYNKAISGIKKYIDSIIEKIEERIFPRPKPVKIKVYKDKR